MKKHGIFRKSTSVLTALCMLLTCVSAGFATVNAVSVDSSDKAAVSAGSPSDFSWDNATVYFLLTDRFRNGNTSNDHSYNRGLDQNGKVVSNIDDRGTFHGGDFAGVTQSIEEGYFDNLGVNALWISAPYEQIHGYVVGDNGSPSFAHYSYHGYYVLDYSQTDANFGTAQEFETLVDTAHKHGIRVIIDIVLNHAGYNSVYDMAEYGYGTVKPGWESSYYSHQGISNSTYHSFIDYDGSASDWGKWWGADWIRCGVAGYKEGGGDPLTSSLLGLPDFKTEQGSAVGIPPILQNKWSKEGTLSQKTAELNNYFSSTGKTRTVTNYISCWLSSWVRNYGVDGFRCDTAKHVEMGSWKTLKEAGVQALKEWRKNNPNKPGANWTDDFWMTGEYWDHVVDYDDYYKSGGFDSMINFSTNGAGVLKGSNVADVYQGYADQINTNDKFNVLSFISSHDEALARGDTNTMNYYGSAFLLLPGGVQIFYGDETNRPLVPGVSFDGYGGAGHSLRSDMNWNSIDQAELVHWQKVGTFRNNHVAVGAGANVKLSATNGVAFGRTYDKNGVEDKIAAVIGASANSTVTVDVSKIWSDGQQVMNAYDQSSAQVTGGKVTFNSGAYGTILIQVPDGRPLMTVSGNAQFKDSQTVTVHLEECDSAKCSIDGGNKFVVRDGSTFTIGSTAFPGDTVQVTLEATNDKGTSTSSAYFKRLEDGVAPTDPVTNPTDPTPAQKQILYVKTWDGSAPYAYVWTGTSTAQCGAWPGTKLTNKTSDGYYYIELNTTDTYNAVINNGAGAKSLDIMGLAGESYLMVENSSYSTKKISGGTPTPTEPSDSEVIIRVKTFDGNPANLYLWNDTDKAINGAWPGGQLSQKDEDGNYVYVVKNTATVNAIVNKNGAQTGNITDLSGEVLIEITDAGCTQFKLTKVEAPLSCFDTLKKEAREVLAMTSTDYTSASWSALQTSLSRASSLILSNEADEDVLSAALDSLKSAKSALKLNPAIGYAVSGTNGITIVAAPASKVTVTVDGRTLTADADDVTGQAVISATPSRSSSISVTATRNGISGTTSYSMSSGDITSYTPPATQPVTQPITQPVTQPTTGATGDIRIGDVDLDGQITVKDATLVQRYASEMATFTEVQLTAADVNHDGEVNVKDATCIQRALAEQVEIH